VLGVFSDLPECEYNLATFRLPGNVANLQPQDRPQLLLQDLKPVFTIHTNEMLALLFHLVRLGVVYAKYDLLAELFKAFFSAPAQAQLGSDKTEHQTNICNILILNVFSNTFASTAANPFACLSACISDLPPTISPLPTPPSLSTTTAGSIPPRIIFSASTEVWLRDPDETIRFVTMVAPKFFSAYDAERMGQSLMCHPSLRGRLSALVAKGLAAEELDKTAERGGDGETADADEARGRKRRRLE